MYSTWLWNLLGDALYALERYDEAHEAYLQAERIDPCDPRTTLNLGYSFLHRGQHEIALNVISRGLAADRAGAYRDRLLAKQAETLAAISCKALDEHQRHVQRRERLQGLPATLKAPFVRRTTHSSASTSATSCDMLMALCPSGLRGRAPRR